MTPKKRKKSEPEPSLEELQRQRERALKSLKKALKEEGETAHNRLVARIRSLNQRIEEALTQSNPRGRGVDPTSLRSRIVQLLDEFPDAEWTAAEVADELEEDPQTVRNLLGNLFREGRIQRVERGVYARR